MVLSFHRPFHSLSSPLIVTKDNKRNLFEIKKAIKENLFEIKKAIEEICSKSIDDVFKLGRNSYNKAQQANDASMGI